MSNLLSKTVGTGTLVLVSLIPGCSSEVASGKQANPVVTHELVIPYKKGDGEKVDVVMSESPKRYAVVGWESVELGNGTSYDKPYVDRWMSVRPTTIALIHLGVGVFLGAAGAIGGPRGWRYLAGKFKQAHSKG